VKFPLVLAEGAEGIAVGLATKILPHNFNDLCRAPSIICREKHSDCPRLSDRGIADFSEYHDASAAGR